MSKEKRKKIRFTINVEFRIAWNELEFHWIFFRRVFSFFLVLYLKLKLINRKRFTFYLLRLISIQIIQFTFYLILSLIIGFQSLISELIIQILHLLHIIIPNKLPFCKFILWILLILWWFLIFLDLFTHQILFFLI
jgi:hypothetical protein